MVTKSTQFTGCDFPQTIKAGPFEVTARIEHDETMGPPWDEHDGHGPVSAWTRREKSPGERVLCEDHGASRYYDFAEAVKIAKRDGWDAPPYGTGTDRERAARAVEEDFQRMRDWCHDEWWWVGLVLSVSKAGHLLDNCAASLWGIESDAGDYLTTVANELLGDALESAEKVVKEIQAN